MNTDMFGCLVEGLRAVVLLAGTAIVPSANADPPLEGVGQFPNEFSLLDPGARDSR